MRNIFDQYKKHENRLTHALACCLAEDADLLRSFIKWATGAPAPKSTKLQIVEQRLPGEPEPVQLEVNDDKRLPDAWIFSESGWALLIESKIESRIDIDQIKGHLNTAARRGFAERRLVCLSPIKPVSKIKFPENAVHQTWSDLYTWATAESRKSDWARRLAIYMEVAERRMIEDEYLTEGTLTKFAGVHFDAENPYNYLEAKRVLNLLMEELRTRKRLAEKLGADLAAPGRGAITGKQANSVWDYIPVVKARGNKSFTSHPHLTLSIQRDKVIAQVTVPNGLNRILRHALFGGGYDSFETMINEFQNNTGQVLKNDTGARPFIEVLQRHYPSQKSTPINDATLKFDPRTLLGDGGGVKKQGQWLRATFDALSHRQSNLQLDIGWEFPYPSNSSIKPSSTVTHEKFLDTAEQSWLACRPILARMGVI